MFGVAEYRPAAGAGGLDLNGPAVRCRPVTAFAAPAIELDTKIFHRERLADVAHKVAFEREPQAIAVDGAVMPPHRLAGRDQLGDDVRQL